MSARNACAGLAVLMLLGFAVAGHAQPAPASQEIGPGDIVGTTAAANLLARCAPAAEVRFNVPRGTRLEVITRQGDWYVVRVFGTGQDGCVRAGLVEFVERGRGPSQPTPSSLPPGAPTPGAAPPSTPPRATRRPSVVLSRAFGYVGLTSFAAERSFETILGSSRGAEFGGGVGAIFRQGFFVQGQLGYFSADGERVFIDNGEVFGLGIPLKVSVTPVDVTAGWRLAFGGRPGGPSTARRGARAGGREPFAPYAGGGVGLVRYRETSSFAEGDENVNESFFSYHVLGGMEFPLADRLAAAAEAQYRWVPNALGESATGVSQAFDETDLGGVAFRVKITYTF